MMFNRLSKTMVLGGFAFAGGLTGQYLLQSLGSAHADAIKPPPPSARPAIVTGNERFEEVVRQVAPAVVSIEAVKTNAVTATATTKSSKPVEESGSGVMIRWPGLKGTIVVTNNHVITGAPADQITVHLADDQVLRPSKVWADPESDLAALFLTREDLPTARLGDSDRAKVGQWVLAFGSPFGLNQTVTHGIISARERGQVSLGNTIRIKDFLQTDAAINPGSSGGALANLDGEIVGINTAIASHSGSNSGVAFSIPTNLVTKILTQLIEKGEVKRGYLGVQLATAMDPAKALTLGLDRVQGALIESVNPETPASKAGVKAGDVILQIEETSIRTENHFINVISTLTPGQKVRLELWRDRRRQTVEAIVGDWAQEKTKLTANP
jgi:serine protease Do